MPKNYHIEYMNLGKEFEYELTEFHTMCGYNIDTLLNVVDKVINHYYSGYVIVDIVKYPNRSRHFDVYKYGLFDIIKSMLKGTGDVINSYDTLITLITQYTIDIDNNFTTYEGKMLIEERNNKIDNILK